jgi:hypothetical protein
LVGKPVGERSRGSTTGRWEDKMDMVLREIRWEGVDWIHLAHDRDQWKILVNAVMNFWVQ